MYFIAAVVVQAEEMKSPRKEQLLHVDLYQIYEIESEKDKNKNNENLNLDILDENPRIAYDENFVVNTSIKDVLKNVKDYEGVPYINEDGSGNFATDIDKKVFS